MPKMPWDSSTGKKSKLSGMLTNGINNIEEILLVRIMQKETIVRGSL